MRETARGLVLSMALGAAGKGDGRCPDFFAARKNERIIWWRSGLAAAGYTIIYRSSLSSFPLASDWSS